MRQLKLEFDEIPPGLNEVIHLCSGHWGNYSKVKAYWKELVRLKTLRSPKFKTVDIEVTLTFPTRAKHDKDNFYACYKFLLDGLCCIEDDNCDVVQNIKLNFAYEKGVKKTEVIIKGE